MNNRKLLHIVRAFVAGSIALFSAIASASVTTDHLGLPPAGFTAADISVNSRNMHYLRGGQGPAVILIHGFPEDWAEYQGIMPRLAKQFTVVAVDLPGIGRSASPVGGSDTADLAAQIHGLAEELHLEKPYIVGHDLGGLVTYAYLRRFPDSLRGAMILDVPMAGVPGSELVPAGLWHIGFIQAPDHLAEKLVTGRQAAFLGWFYDLGKFTPEERRYFTGAYGARQLHGAFEIYRAFAIDAKWNADQTASDPVPLTVAVGEKSLFAPLLSKFIDGYRAKGMTNVEGAQIPDAGHYLLADNPGAVCDLIKRQAGGAL